MHWRASAEPGSVFFLVPDVVGGADPARADTWGLISTLARTILRRTGKRLWVCREPQRIWWRQILGKPAGMYESHILMDPSWSIAVQDPAGEEVDLISAAWFLPGLLQRDIRFRLKGCPDCLPALLTVPEEMIRTALHRQTYLHRTERERQAELAMCKSLGWEPRPHACPVCGCVQPEQTLAIEEQSTTPTTQPLRLCA